VGLVISERDLSMEGKRPKRNPMPEWAKEEVGPPEAEIQVYRRREDDPKRWEYLGRVAPEREMDLDFLETAHAEELELQLPYELTKELWGGGRYQFRFIWRDEEGHKKTIRTRNGAIWGRPFPRLDSNR
jgi:hypothetical protein